VLKSTEQECKTAPSSSINLLFYRTAKLMEAVNSFKYIHAIHNIGYNWPNNIGQNWVHRYRDITKINLLILFRAFITQVALLSQQYLFINTHLVKYSTIPLSEVCKSTLNASDPINSEIYPYSITILTSRYELGRAIIPQDVLRKCSASNAVKKSRKRKPDNQLIFI
jgi:hypothetical protein